MARSSGDGPCHTPSDQPRDIGVAVAGIGSGAVNTFPRSKPLQLQRPLLHILSPCKAHSCN